MNILEQRTLLRTTEKIKADRSFQIRAEHVESTINYRDTKPVRSPLDADRSRFRETSSFVACLSKCAESALLRRQKTRTYRRNSMLSETEANEIPKAKVRYGAASDHYEIIAPED